MKYALLSLIAILISAAPEQDQPKKDYKALADKIKVTVEPKVKSNAAWKDIVEWVNNKSNWEEVLKALDEKLGINRNMTIMVTVTTQNNPSPAVGGGNDQKKIGLLYIIAPTVVTWAQKDGFDIPTFMKMCITHEISHCYQMNSRFEPLPPKHRWPWWLYEGMGDYAADYMVRLKDIAGKPVKDLDSYTGTADKPVSSLEPYSRGLLFYKHLGEAYGEDKLKQFVKAILIDEKPYKKAIQEVTGKDWNKFKTDERAWSEEFAKKNSGK